MPVVQRLLQIPLVRENINNARNGNYRELAIACAYQQGHHNIVQLLQQHGAVLPEYLRNQGPQLNINRNQSVHEVSVHVSVSHSAKNLFNHYHPNADFIKTSLRDMKDWLDNPFHSNSVAPLPSDYDPKWLEPAKNCYERLSEIEFEDQRSGVTMQQALALVWAGINNPNEFEKIAKTEPVERLDRRLTLLKNLYEVQRGYNLIGDGANPVDNNEPDNVTCVSGSFNKLIAALASVGHSGVEIIFVTKELITQKAKILTQEAFKNLSEAQKAHFALNWESEQSDDIQAEYFNLIKPIVEQKMHDEFYAFSDKINGGTHIAINDAMSAIEYVNMTDIMKAYEPKPAVILDDPVPILQFSALSLTSKHESEEQKLEQAGAKNTKRPR